MKHYILSIDPGTTQSAYTVCDLVDGVPVPVQADKVDNHVLRNKLVLYAIKESIEFDYMVIEKVVSYGQSVGQEVFTTCEWIGRFTEILNIKGPVYKISRRVVKDVLTDNQAKTDSQIKQVICDRLVPGASNHGKGSKSEPTMFYGFRADMWQAYAVALTVHDIGNKDKLREYSEAWG